jgi:hypothetical protein
MPNMVTLRFVNAQIAAMRVSLFEVGAYKPSQSSASERQAEMLMRTWDSDSLIRSVGWLRFQNLQGRNIYIRPKGEHPLSLLDDLSYESVQRMKLEGFDPAVVVETSVGNFQALGGHPKPANEGQLKTGQ